MKKLALSLCSILLLTGCASSAGNKANENTFVSGNGSAVVIKEADRKPAPEISGQVLDGSELKLAKGKVTVLNVWASWCSPCRAEAPTLQDFANKNPNIQFVGILTRDNLSAAQAFVNRFKITYPSFVDDSLIAKFRGSLPANAIPTTLVIDSKGLVAARISGEATVAILSEVLSKVAGSAVNA
jgi:thiol-disulfide isomerase/thioredoxin